MFRRTDIHPHCCIVHLNVLKSDVNKLNKFKPGIAEPPCFNQLQDLINLNIPAGETVVIYWFISTVWEHEAK